jgi:hypothetical protein
MHNGYEREAKHPEDKEPINISDTIIDTTGKYLISARC